jgi:hypothetical protein
VIDGDAFDDCLQQHRLAGARRSDDECPLAVPDWRDEIDCAPRELRSALGWTPGLQLEFSLGVRSDQRAEIGTPRGLCWILIVDFLDVDDDDAIAMVVSGCRCDLIAATERILANQLHRHVSITWLSEVTEVRSANESAFPLRIEPTDRLTIRNYWGEWCTGLVAFTALAGLLSTALATLTTATAALSSSALIATATSVVAIVAMAFALMLSLTTTAASATLMLRIVLRLRLLLSAGVFVAVAARRRRA